MSGKEKFSSIDELPLFSRWDGKSKYFTEECEKCEHYKPFSDGEACFVGVAWKRLDRTKTLKSCSSKKSIEAKKVEKAPEETVAVYTPSWIDFID